MIEAYVYHIEDPQHPGDTSYGYIGVVTESKGVFKRFREHCKTSRMGQVIKENNVKFDNVRTIYSGTRKQCQQLEKELRPKERIGWNISIGGSGYNYTRIGDISKFRSELQSSRMLNEDLKRKQGETFKLNYYSDAESIALRKKRAKEHMASKSGIKCLNAMHRKVKCPYCEFVTNHGNMRRHIKSKHVD
jgi:hypothetical protein